MPGVPHEGIVLLFRERPSLAGELLRDGFEIALPAKIEARIEDAEVGEVVPVERRADLVVALEPDLADVVVEVQRAPDPNKRWRWPAYLAERRARYRRDVYLLVVSPDARVARWCARPIPMGQPGWVLTPFVLGPTEVPKITTAERAAASPELAVLSSIVHEGGEDGRVAVCAWQTAASLDDERARVYADLVHATLGDAARLALEAMMQSGSYEYQSEFAKKYLEQGETKGRAEGEARALLTVLESRGLDVYAAARGRILGCGDLEQLERWLRRAAAVTTVDELFE